MKTVFIIGGTGYIGRRLITQLFERGNIVKAFIRKGSEGKLPSGCEVITGNPFDANTFEKYISPSHVLFSCLVCLTPLPERRNCSKLLVSPL